jgi:signal transduction histidine kinase
LAPVRLEPEGLSAALRELAVQCAELFNIACGFHDPQRVLVDNGEGATHLYRIAQEAVHNAVRHGRARRIRIALERLGKRVRLRIVDNGKGIGTLSPRRKGLGLRIMQYRVGLLQGSFSVRRQPKGGTEVCCTIPAEVLQKGRAVL